MKKVSVRFVQNNDAKGLIEIYAPYVTETPITCECEVPSVQEFQDRIQKISKTFPYVVCEIDGELVGYSYASLHKERAAYRWDSDATVYVSSNYHRNKIGTALYNCMLELNKLQGFYNIYAVVTTANEGSIKFHEAFGFVPMGTYTNTAFKLGKWHNITVMEKKLKEYDLEPKETLSIKDIDSKIIEKLFTEAEEIVAETFVD